MADKTAAHVCMNAHVVQVLRGVVLSPGGSCLGLAEAK